MALLLKRNKHLYVYETLSKDGSKLRHWKDFIRYYWNLLYEKIVYRRLNLHIEEGSELLLTDREEKGSLIDDTERKIIEYIQTTEKMPYRLTCTDIFCKGGPGQKEKNREWNKMKGYYCSSLVAGAYIHSGILCSSNKSATKYLPEHFSEKLSPRKLVFNPNFSLGPEIILDFTGSL